MLKNEDVRFWLLIILIFAFAIIMTFVILIFVFKQSFTFAVNGLIGFAVLAGLAFIGNYIKNKLRGPDARYSS
jgi:hypothetical protein